MPLLLAFEMKAQWQTGGNNVATVIHLLVKTLLAQMQQMMIK